MGLNIPSFYGYFTAHRSIAANQAALNTINHNIANVNTQGYSRQRVDLAINSPFPPATRSNYLESGQLGQGVKILGISRTHDLFLDGQIRTQNSAKGMQDIIKDYMQQMEGIVAEPIGYGASSAMTDFFAAAQALSIRADDQTARTTFIQSAKNMLDIFRQEASQLMEIRTGVVGDASIPSTVTSSLAAITTAEINTELKQLANVNSQIITVVGAGGQPNDLLDQRDLLLDSLSKKININVEYTGSEQVTVRLGNNILVRGKDVLNTLNIVPNTTVTADDDPALIELSSNPGVSVNANITGGTLGGMLAVGGNAPGAVTIRSFVGQLNTLFTELANQVNALQGGGYDYYGNSPSTTPPNDEIFTLAGGTGLEIFRYSVNPDILADPKLIAAADGSGAFAGVGDGRNAMAMARLADVQIGALGSSTMHQFFNDELSKLGVSSKSAKDSSEVLGNVIAQLEQRRESFQGVNMEEEMIDMLRFQRSFEASAKMMSTIDKVMDTIINRIF